MLKETRFPTMAAVYTQSSDGHVKGPFQIGGGMLKQPRNEEQPFVAMHTAAFHTNALKTRGVLDGKKSQFAMVASSFEGAPSVAAAGAVSSHSLEDTK
mmetsp:Transcript_12844/g.20332  ORF Transcript_12844/g.20332 Transcript_12844/m.20332 type:complete len:98 (+) Transcript_12844:114-407(+)